MRRVERGQDGQFARHQEDAARAPAELEGDPVELAEVQRLRPVGVQARQGR